MQRGLALHGGHRQAAEMTPAPGLRSWRSWCSWGGWRAWRAWLDALSLFTVIPVARSATISRQAAARAIWWLPVVGGLQAGLAAGAMAAAELGGRAAHSAPRQLLAATLAV